MAILATLVSSVSAYDITTLNNNDPMPLYTSQYPYAGLGIKEREYIKTHHKSEKPSHFGLSISPFYQRARCGKDTCGNKAELGDIKGKWNYLALINDDANTNSNPCSVAKLNNVGQNLLNDFDRIFINSDLPPEISSIGSLLETQQSSTTLQDTLGIFSVEGKYCKRGVRFVMESVVCGGFGFSLKSGISNISFCPTFVDQTPSATNDNPLVIRGDDTSYTTTQWGSIVKDVQNDVMSQKNQIAQAIGLDICEYKKTDMEDLYGELFWRHPFEMNKRARRGEWPHFLFIPWVLVGGSIDIAKARDPRKAFSIPSGNNGHRSWYVRAGFALDFFETLEISTAVGYTSFNSKTHNDVYVPNTLYQSSVFPCRANVCVRPGSNFDWGIALYSHHFLAGSHSALDYLSFYLQYRYMSHQEDKYSVLQDSTNCDATSYTSEQLAMFIPQQLNCVSGFSMQVFNLGFNYDISPNMMIGFGAQVPYKRRGSFRSTTLIGTLEFTF